MKLLPPQIEQNTTAAPLHVNGKVPASHAERKALQDEVTREFHDRLATFKKDGMHDADLKDHVPYFRDHLNMKLQQIITELKPYISKESKKLTGDESFTSRVKYWYEYNGVVLAKNDEEEKLTPAMLCDIILEHCTPRKNKLNGEYIFQVNNTKGATLKTTLTLNELCSNISIQRGSEIKCSTIKIHAEAMAENNIFNPAKEWFTALPTWDGYDYIKDYFECLGITEDADLVLSIFRRYLASHVDMIMDEGMHRVNRNVIVLHGEQRIGKDTWAGNLFRPLYGGVAMGMPKWTREDTFKLSGSQLWLLSEIDRVKGNSKIKDLISRTSGNEVKMYVQTSDLFIRISSFMGTTNEEFLFDSNNTRFYTFYCRQMIMQPNGFDFIQLWAQAKHHYATDANSTWFSPAELAYQERSNKLSQAYTPIEEHVRDMFEVSSTGMLRVSEIVNFVRAIYPATTGNAIGRALTKMGADTISKRIDDAVHKFRGVIVSSRGKQVNEKLESEREVIYDLDTLRRTRSDTVERGTPPKPKVVEPTKSEAVEVSKFVSDSVAGISNKTEKAGSRKKVVKSWSKPYRD
jgi:predicted P-loop ATPase